MHGHSLQKKLGAFLHGSLFLWVRRKGAMMSTEKLFKIRMTVEKFLKITEKQWVK